jgi:hypothetical protein
LPATLSTASADARRLVLGAAIGFDVEQVRVFVESLRGSGYGGDVMMLIAWPGLRVGRYLKGHGVDVVRVFQTRSFSRSVHAKRYAIYLDYLRARTGHYDQVMMADVRDVVFQGNPFAGIDDPKCHFYLEAPRTIGEDATNLRWVRGCFPAAEAEALAHHRISCSGITIGGTAEIIAYLEHMVAKIAAMPLRIYRTIGHGYDQAIHNYLVYLDRGIDGVVEENNGHIATMALEPREFYRLDEAARISGPDGRLFPICHQYDRFADIRAAVEARYAGKPGAA